MSEQKDNIKSVFDQAFESEQIPFDMNAWNEMEKMLNKRERKRAIWLWFAGLVIFVSAASWYGLDAQPNAIYSPRSKSVNHAGAMQNAIADNRPTEFGERSVERIEDRSSVQSEAVNATNKGIRPSIAVADAGKVIKPVTANSGKPLRVNAVHNGIGEKEMFDDVKPVAEAVDPIGNSFLDSTIAVPRAQVLRPKNNVEALSLMPILDIPIDYSRNAIEGSSKPNQSILDRAKHFYARAGISKSRMHSGGMVGGIGQFGAIGGQLQFRPHLLITGELGINRSRVFDQVVYVGPKTYGYSVNENESNIVTNEMLDFEIPLILQYRKNRLVLGAGVSPQFLLGIKNSTDQIVSNESGTLNYNSMQGYYQWNRYRRMNLSTLIDAQYQISYDAYIGTRANIGVLNRAIDGRTNAGFARFELYLRINLK